MGFAEDWTASRRLFVLRLLIEVGGEANEANVYKACQQGGFARDTRDDTRRDLDHLVKVGCVAQEWYNDAVRVVKITERGREAAHGKVAVAGVERSDWER